MMKRKPASYKLTETAILTLKRLAEKRGQSQAAVLERLIREEGERAGIEIEMENLYE